MKLPQILACICLTVISISTSHAGKCAGSSGTCTACTTCKACGHCAKGGGTCSVCR